MFYYLVFDGTPPAHHAFECTRVGTAYTMVIGNAPLISNSDTGLIGGQDHLRFRPTPTGQVSLYEEI
jgi:hypothetical protein